MESGEGIESCDTSDVPLIGRAHVESGEGIERHIVALYYLFDRPLWNPVKELKAAFPANILNILVLKVESGEGIERGISGKGVKS